MNISRLSIAATRRVSLIRDTTPMAHHHPLMQQSRFNAEHQENRRARLDAKNEMSYSLRREAQDLTKAMETQVEEAVVANDDIPKKYKEFIITHIGTMDGVDEKLDNPKEVTRSEAFAIAENDLFDICFIKNVGGKAECRLRYLKLYTRRQVSIKTKGAIAGIQKKLKNIHMKTPEGEENVKLRSIINPHDLARKVSDVVKFVEAGKIVRLSTRYIWGLFFF